MIIFIESYFGDTLLTGPKTDVYTLRKQARALWDEVHYIDFVKTFCARYHYEVLEYDNDIAPDVVIDLDIGRVTPR